VAGLSRNGCWSTFVTAMPVWPSALAAGGPAGRGGRDTYRGRRRVVRAARSGPPIRGRQGADPLRHRRCGQPAISIAPPWNGARSSRPSGQPGARHCCATWGHQACLRLAQHRIRRQIRHDPDATASTSCHSLARRHPAHAPASNCCAFGGRFVRSGNATSTATPGSGFSAVVAPFAVSRIDAAG